MITHINNQISFPRRRVRYRRVHPPGGKDEWAHSILANSDPNLLLENPGRCTLWQVLHPLTFLPYLSSVTYYWTKWVSRSSLSMSARHSQTHPLNETVSFLNLTSNINPITRRIQVAWVIPSSHPATDLNKLNQSYVFMQLSIITLLCNK